MQEHHEKKNPIDTRGDAVSYILICIALIGATLFYIWWNTPVENTLPEVYGVM